MKTSRTLIAILAIGGLLGAAIPTASAHATSYTPDGKIKFVYGHLNEPAYTFTKTGLDLGIYDNATGGPISGLESVDHDGKLNPKIETWYVYAGQTLELTDGFKAQFGQPGKYTYPITFTKPGAYSLRIKGTINGTAVDQTLAPAHPIEALDDIMWPEKVASNDDLDQRLTTLESKVASGGHVTKGNAPGLDAVALLGLLGVATIVLRRRGGA